uniref:Uncharacterized protein n=1 Tax=Eptatretus burgeri TaxID=7764 RepID=A0A8C4N4V5_EPTBU
MSDSNWHAELEEVVVQRDELQREKEMLVSKNHSLEQSLNAEKERKKTLHMDKLEEEKKVQAMEEQLAHTSELKKQADLYSQGQLDSLQRQLESLFSKNDSLKQTLNDEVKRREAVEADRWKLQKKAKKMEVELNACSDAIRRPELELPAQDELQIEKEQLVLKNRSLEQELHDEAERRKTIESDKRGLEKKLKDLAEQLDHRTEPTRHAELKESLALQDKLQRENEIFFTKIHSLEQSLRDEEDRRKTVEADLWNKEKKVKEMDEELDELYVAIDNRKASYNTILNEMSEQLTEERQLSAELQSRLNVSVCKIQDHRTKHGRTMAGLKAGQSQMGVQQTLEAKQVQKLKEAQSHRDQLLHEKEEWSSTNHSLEQSLRDEEERRRTLETEKWELQKKANEMEEELDELYLAIKNNKISFVERFNELSQQLNKEKEHAAALESKIELCASKDKVDPSENKTVTELRSMLEETKLALEAARSKSRLPATETESTLKMKLTKMKVEYCEAMKKQESLKSALRNKDRAVRLLKENLRKSRDEAFITFAELSVPKSEDHLTEGGGSGTVQNSHVLVLQNANQALQNRVSSLEKELSDVKTGSCVSKFKDAAYLYKAEVRRLRSENSSLSEKLQVQASASSNELSFPSETPCSPVKKLGTVDITPLSPIHNLKIGQSTISEPRRFFSEGGSAGVPRGTRFFDNKKLDTLAEDPSPQVSSLKDVELLNDDTADQSTQCKQM